MLQQTQAQRVTPKYREFLRRFPTPAALARARLQEVLSAWSGLGYNHRALALKRLAEEVCGHRGGSIPREIDELVALPGIGPATAAAVRAFAFNEPSLYLDTNVRAVFIHEFFKGRRKVRDREILPVLERTLDRRNPRAWYYALLDYGAHLKRTVPNPSRKSAHHVRQSPFKDSERELRGIIIRTVLKSGKMTVRTLADRIGKEAVRVEAAAVKLAKEGLVAMEGKSIVPAL
jgi:A/G-specific adenine glycosylase